MWYPALKVFILLLMALPSLAQTNGKSHRGPFYLKHPLIFFKGELPKVLSDNIIFTDSCICSFSPQVYSSDIIIRGNLIVIEDIDTQNDWAKVTFAFETQKYEILLKNDSNKNFKKSFGLLFSERKIRDLEINGLETKKQLIKYYGYPISACKEGNVERWFYILEFSGDAYNYDGCCIEIKNNKVVSVSGYI